MAKIVKMNINGTPYDLAGNGTGSQYFPGDGIIIDPDGFIKVDPDLVTDATKIMIAGNSERISGVESSLNGVWLFAYTLSEGYINLRNDFIIDSSETRNDIIGLDGRMTSLSNTASGLSYTIYGSEGEPGALDSLDNIKKRFIFNDDGLTISAGDNKTYTVLDTNGMTIKRGTKTIAEATSNMFKSNYKLGVKDWVFEPKAITGTTKRLLNIYKG